MIPWKMRYHFGIIVCQIFQDKINMHMYFDLLYQQKIRAVFHGKVLLSLLVFTCFFYLVIYFFLCHLGSTVISVFISSVLKVICPSHFTK